MAFRNVTNQLTYVFSSVVPKNKKMWTFGAWIGNRYSDNPKAFLKYMIKYHPEYKYNWISKIEVEDPEVADKCNFLKYGSIEAWKAIIRSRFLVMSHGTEDFARLNWTGGSIRVQLFHGVAWKRFGVDSFKPSGHIIKDYLRLLNLRWAHRLESKGDFLPASSEKNAKVLMSALCVSKESLINAGQPRNEVFYDLARCVEIKKNVLQQIGVGDLETKIILYLPTFRDSCVQRFSFNEIEEVLNSRLNKAIIIEKSHFAEKSKLITKNSTCIYDGSNIDTQELMAAADLLITDYSSCLFDFLCTDRPVIQFLYDYNYYMSQDRGLYYSVEEIDCGHIAFNTTDIVEMLSEFCMGRLSVSDKQMVVKHEMITFESSENSERIYRAISSKIK